MTSALVVDADTPARVLLGSTLKNRGWEATLVGSGEEAVRALEHRTFDLVVTEYDLPKKGGIWVIYHTIRLQPEARRVLISSQTRSTILSLAKTGVVHAVLSKPLAADDIGAALTC